MLRSLSALLLVAAALAGGCLPTDFLLPDHATEGAPLVPTSPFAAPPPATTSQVFSAKPAPSSSGVAIKVDEIGQKLLSTNPKLAMKPLFLTIGTPQPEIFHRETSALYVTEGLVRQCKSEGELAAVMSVELGRMFAERESLVSPDMRTPEKHPTMAIPMGNAGQFSGLDQLQLVEQSRLDGERKRPSKKYVPPDPLVLAGGYLEAAGFERKELDSVAPLLRQADKNYILEKQFKGAGQSPSPSPSWSPK